MTETGVDLRAAFAPLDWGVLGLYLAFLVAVGFWKRQDGGTENYLIAGRNLSLPVFVATLVATFYGGILGAGEFVYTSGVVAWTSNGVPYYIFALLFAVFLARRVRGGAAHIYTIPDKLAEAYDTKTALLGAVFAFVYAAPSTYVLMAGTLLHILFGWPLIPAMLVGVVFSIAYVFRGGFLADVRVNTLQFLLMFAGFGSIVALCLHRFGGLSFLTAPGHLPPSYLKPMGDYDLAGVAVWFFIALETLTDPGFHQRCYAAKTPRVAAVGIGLAVLCWLTFDLLSLTTGLFSRALLPHLADPKLAFPALAERILPPGLKGLFYVGMLAPIMASLVSYTFIAAVTVGRDFVWRLRGDTDNLNVPAYTRWGLVGTSLLALVVAVLVPSVVKQWYAFGSVLVPGVLIPLLGAYAAPRWRAPATFAFFSMLLGAGLALFCLLWGWGHGGIDNPSYPGHWQPLYPGLLVAALVYGAGLVFGRRRRNAAYSGTL